MKNIAAELRQQIAEYRIALEKIPGEKLSVAPAPGKWTGKQVIGHLADSAENNIRRLIKAQYEDEPLITYRQDDWVNISNYTEWPAHDVINLWYLLNIQYAFILENMKPGMEERLCKTPEPHTLRWLASDYLLHLRHHMQHLLGWEPVAYP